MGKTKTGKSQGKQPKTGQSSPSASGGHPAHQLQQTVGNQTAMGSGFFETESKGNQYQLPQIGFLQGFNRDLHTHYDHMPSASDKTAFPHLNQEEDGKRKATLREPSDKAALVKQARDQGRALDFSWLEAESLFEPDTTHELGFIRNPPAKQLKNEQHFFDSSGSFTPYPAEAKHLQDMASDGRSERDVWQALDAVNRGQKPQEEFKDNELPLQSVPTITNISEVQRSPLMGASSNLEIANNAQKKNPISFEEAFGHSETRTVKKRKKKEKTNGKMSAKRKKNDSDEKEVQFNLPGTISATGSGAVHQFDAVEKSLMSGDLSEESIRKKVKRAPKGSNVDEARDLAVQKRDSMLQTFGERIKMTDIEYAQSIPDTQGRMDATYGRLMSGVRRNTMPQMGLLPYNLRPLAKQDSGSTQTSFNFGQDTEKIVEEYFNPPGDDEEEFDIAQDDSALPDDFDIEPEAFKIDEEEDDDQSPNSSKIG